MFGFNFLPITSIFLDLTLYNTLISITLSPRLNCSFDGVTSKSILKAEPNNIRLQIPYDEANTDYQQYLEWAKTNTAEAAD